MIAEPSSEVRDLICIVVRRLGHEAVVLDASREDGPTADLVVAEPAWPEAQVVVERLSADGRSVPVVCTSIYARSATREVPGCVAYIVKPFTLQELKAAILTALGPEPPPA